MGQTGGGRPTTASQKQDSGCTRQDVDVTCCGEVDCRSGEIFIYSTSIKYVDTVEIQVNKHTKHTKHKAQQNTRIQALLTSQHPRKIHNILRSSNNACTDSLFPVYTCWHYARQCASDCLFGYPGGASSAGRGRTIRYHAIVLRSGCLV